jgi:hypothetical protein
MSQVVRFDFRLVAGVGRLRQGYGEPGAAGRGLGNCERAPRGGTRPTTASGAEAARSGDRRRTGGGGRQQAERRESAVTADATRGG